MDTLSGSSKNTPLSSELSKSDAIYSSKATSTSSNTDSNDKTSGKTLNLVDQSVALAESKDGTVATIKPAESNRVATQVATSTLGQKHTVGTTQVSVSPTVNTGPTAAAILTDMATSKILPHPDVPPPKIPIMSTGNNTSSSSVIPGATGGAIVLSPRADTVSATIGMSNTSTTGGSTAKQQHVPSAATAINTVRSQSIVPVALQQGMPVPKEMPLKSVLPSSSSAVPPVIRDGNHPVIAIDQSNLPAGSNNVKATSGAGLPPSNNSSSAGVLFGSNSANLLSSLQSVTASGGHILNTSNSASNLSTLGGSTQKSGQQPSPHLLSGISNLTDAQHQPSQFSPAFTSGFMFGSNHNPSGAAQTGGSKDGKSTTGRSETTSTTSSARSSSNYAGTTSPRMIPRTGNSNLPSPLPVPNHGISKDPHKSGQQISTIPVSLSANILPLRTDIDEKLRPSGPALTKSASEKMIMDMQAVPVTIRSAAEIPLPANLLKLQSSAGGSHDSKSRSSPMPLPVPITLPAQLHLPLSVKKDYSGDGKSANKVSSGAINIPKALTLNEILPGKASPIVSSKKVPTGPVASASAVSNSSSSNTTSASKPTYTIPTPKPLKSSESKSTKTASIKASVPVPTPVQPSPAVSTKATTSKKAKPSVEPKDTKANEKDSKGRDAKTSAPVAVAKPMSQESMNIKAAAAALIKEQQGLSQGSTMPALMRRYQVVSDKVASIDRKRMMTEKSLPFHASRLKSHWDYVIDEVQWMAVDYKQERRWKMKSCFAQATLCAESVFAKKQCQTEHVVSTAGDDFKDCSNDYFRWTTSMEKNIRGVSAHEMSKAKEVSHQLSGLLVGGLVSVLVSKQKTNSNNSTFAALTSVNSMAKTALTNPASMSVDDLLHIDNKVQSVYRSLQEELTMKVNDMSALPVTGAGDTLTSVQTEAVSGVLRLNMCGVGGLVVTNAYEPLSAGGGSMSSVDSSGATAVGAGIVCSWGACQTRAPVLIVTNKYNIFMWKHEIRKKFADATFDVLGVDDVNNYYGIDVGGSEKLGNDVVPDFCFCISYETLEILTMLAVSAPSTFKKVSDKLTSTASGSTTLSADSESNSISSSPTPQPQPQRSCFPHVLEKYRSIAWKGVMVDVRQLGYAVPSASRPFAASPKHTTATTSHGSMDEDFEAPWNPNGLLFAVPEEAAPVESTTAASSSSEKASNAGPTSSVNYIQKDLRRVKDMLYNNYVAWLKAATLLLNITREPCSDLNSNVTPCYRCCLSNVNFLSPEILRGANDTASKAKGHSASNSSTVASKKGAITAASSVTIAAAWLSFSVPSAFATVSAGNSTQPSDVKFLGETVAMAAAKWVEYNKNHPTNVIASTSTLSDFFLRESFLPLFCVEVKTNTPRFVNLDDLSEENSLSGPGNLAIAFQVKKVDMSAKHRQKYQNILDFLVKKTFAFEGSAVSISTTSTTSTKSVSIAAEKEKERSQEKHKKQQEENFAQAIVVLRRLCFHEKCVDVVPICLNTGGRSITDTTCNHTHSSTTAAQNNMKIVDEAFPGAEAASSPILSENESLQLTTGLSKNDLFLPVNSVSSQHSNNKLDGMLSVLNDALAVDCSKIVIVVETIEEQIMTHRYLDRQCIPHLFAGDLGASGLLVLASGQSGCGDDSERNCAEMRDSRIFNWYAAQKAVLEFNDSTATDGRIIVISRWLLGDEGISGEAHQLVSSFTSVLPHAATDVIILSSDWVTCLTEVDYSTWWSYEDTERLTEKKITRVVFKNTLEDRLLSNFNMGMIFGKRVVDAKDGISIDVGFDTSSLFASGDDILPKNIKHNSLYWKHDVRIRCPLAYFQGKAVEDIVLKSSNIEDTSSAGCEDIGMDIDGTHTPNPPLANTGLKTSFFDFASIPDSSREVKKKLPLELAHIEVSFLCAAPLLTAVINRQEELTKKHDLLQRKEQFNSSCSTPSGLEPGTPMPLGLGIGKGTLGRGMGKGLLAQGQDGRPVHAESLPWLSDRKPEDVACRAVAARNYILSMKKNVRRIEKVFALVGCNTNERRVRFSPSLMYQKCNGSSGDDPTDCLTYKGESLKPLKVLSYKLNRLFRTGSEGVSSLLPKKMAVETSKKKVVASALTKAAKRDIRVERMFNEGVHDVLWAIDENFFRKYSNGQARKNTSSMVCQLCNIFVRLRRRELFFRASISCDTLSTNEIVVGSKLMKSPGLNNRGMHVGGSARIAPNVSQSGLAEPKKLDYMSFNSQIEKKNCDKNFVFDFSDCLIREIMTPILNNANTVKVEPLPFDQISNRPLSPTANVVSALLSLSPANVQRDIPFHFNDLREFKRTLPDITVESGPTFQEYAQHYLGEKFFREGFGVSVQEHTLRSLYEPHLREQFALATPCNTDSCTINNSHLLARGAQQLGAFRATMQEVKRKGQLADTFLYTNPLDMATGRDVISCPSYLRGRYNNDNSNHSFHDNADNIFNSREITIVFKGCDERRFSSLGKDDVSTGTKRGGGRKKGSTVDPLASKDTVNVTADDSKNSGGKSVSKEKNGGPTASVSSSQTSIGITKDHLTSSTRARAHVEMPRFHVDGTGWRNRSMVSADVSVVDSGPGTTAAAAAAAKRKRQMSNSTPTANGASSGAGNNIVSGLLAKSMIPDRKAATTGLQDPYRAQPFHSSVIMAGMRLLDSTTGNTKKKPWTELETKVLLDMSGALQESVLPIDGDEESTQPTSQTTDTLETIALANVSANQKPLPLATNWVLEKVLSAVAPLAALTTVSTKNQSMHSAQDVIYQYKFQARQHAYKKQREQAEIDKKSNDEAKVGADSKGDVSEGGDRKRIKLCEGELDNTTTSSSSLLTPAPTTLPGVLPMVPSTLAMAAATAAAAQLLRPNVVDTQARKRVRSLIGLSKVNESLLALGKEEQKRKVASANLPGTVDTSLHAPMTTGHRESAVSGFQPPLPPPALSVPVRSSLSTTVGDISVLSGMLPSPSPQEPSTPNTSLLCAPCHSSQLKDISETKLLNPLQIANNIKILQQEKQQQTASAVAYKSVQANKSAQDGAELERERAMRERERAEKNSSITGSFSKDGSDIDRVVINGNVSSIGKRLLDPSHEAGAPNGRVQKLDSSAVFSSHSTTKSGVPGSGAITPSQLSKYPSSSATNNPSISSQLATLGQATTHSTSNTSNSQSSAVLNGMASSGKMSLGVSGGVPGGASVNTGFVPSSSGTTAPLVSTKPVIPKTVGGQINPQVHPVQHPSPMTTDPVISSIVDSNKLGTKQNTQPSTASPQGSYHLSNPGVSVNPPVSCTPVLNENFKAGHTQVNPQTYPITGTSVQSGTLPQAQVPQAQALSNTQSSNSVLSKYSLSNISISGTSVGANIPREESIKQEIDIGRTISQSAAENSKCNPSINLSTQRSVPQGAPPSSLVSTQNLADLKKKAENDPKIKAELVSILSCAEISDQKKTEMLKRMMIMTSLPTTASLPIPSGDSLKNTDVTVNNDTSSNVTDTSTTTTNINTTKNQG